jgi:hypothetical protein
MLYIHICVLYQVEWLRKETLAEVEKQRKVQETIYEWDEEEEGNAPINTSSSSSGTIPSHATTSQPTTTSQASANPMGSSRSSTASLRESQAHQIEAAVKLACFDNHEGLTPEQFLSIFTFVIVQAGLEKPLTMRSLLWTLCEPSLLKGERG